MDKDNSINNEILKIDSNIETNLIFKDDKIKVEKVTEGKATVFLKNEENTFSAFYNPAQVYLYIII